RLRIALRYEKKLVHLEQPLQRAPDSKTATLEAVDAYYELVNAQQEVACLMLAIKAFHACKQEDSQSMSSYLLKMKGHLDTLECLGYPMPQELGHGKTIAELHAMLKLTKKGLPKKAATPAILATRGGKI
ncbi:hypothetical protein Tco_1535935, partial [Tanacetum coccineum]